VRTGHTLGTCGPDGVWVCCTSQDVVTNLATIYTTTRSDNLRPTAVSALARLLRHSPAFVQLLADRFGVRFLVAGELSARFLPPSVGLMAKRAVGFARRTYQGDDHTWLRNVASRALQASPTPAPRCSSRSSTCSTWPWASSTPGEFTRSPHASRCSGCYAVNAFVCYWSSPTTQRAGKTRSWSFVLRLRALNTNPTITSAPRLARALTFARTLPPGRARCWRRRRV
jgi:hypothetical protein